MAGVVTPAVGDLLADRYSLAAHVNDDSTGRQVWRGMDVLLNRPVTVVLRTPGGDDAAEMLSAAVAASRVNHPNIVGVYDAVDQGDCAYIVREWVEGQSLRDSIMATVLPVGDAVDIVQCVAAAVAAVHASGVAHGNIHPGTILLSTDDRVVLADPRADAVATQVGDVRALGATLYCALTGGWPRTVPGPASLPDAPTDATGAPIPPNQLRDDIPDRLNRLICDMLTAQVAPPTAIQLEDELAHLSRGPDTGALAIVAPAEPGDEDTPVLPPKVAKRRLAVGAAVLIGLAAIGLLAALIVIPSDDPGGANDASSGNDNGGEGGDEQSAPQELKLEAGDVQVVDPDDGDTMAINDLGHVVDRDGTSSWKTEEYKQQNWGGFKEGVGLLLNLGDEMNVAKVQIQMPTTGNTVALYTGANDMPGTQPDLKELDVIADPVPNDQTDLNLTVNTDAPETRYLLVWCSVPAATDSGAFQWMVDEITVYAN